MPKTKGIKGAFKHFQLKIYGDEITRWEKVVWKAKERAVERRAKVTDADINRAILGMPDVPKWLVTDKERLYFQGRISLPEDIGNAVIVARHATTPADEVEDINTDTRTGLPRRRNQG